MQNFKKRFLALLCAGTVLTGSAAAASIHDFPDAQGHWAYDALSRAVEDKLLQGDEGRLLPSGSLTGAQMAAILNRVLDASNTDRAYPNTPAGQWYTADASKAASLGILPLDGSVSLNKPVTRAQVFEAIAAAFGLAEAAPDESVLRNFSDTNTLTPAQRRAAAVLVRDEILSGTQDGSLQAARGITRAEFVSLVYRIWSPNYLTAPELLQASAPAAEPPVSDAESALPEEPSTPPEEAPAPEQALEAEPSASDTDPAYPEEEPSSEQTPAPEPEDEAPDAGEPEQPAPQPEEPSGGQAIAPVYLFFQVPDDLDRTAAYDRMVLRGEDMAPVFTDGDPVSVQRLVIATTGNAFALSNETGNTFGTVVIGGGTGAVTLEQNTTSQVEITGSGRTIYLNGLTLDSLLVSGSGNTIVADSATSIDRLRVTAGATGNTITVDGVLASADVGGAYTVLGGAGHAANVFVTAKRCDITLAADTLDDSKVDNGLEGVKVTVTAPKVAPGGQITATATIQNVDKARICDAQWYYDGQPEAAFVNHSFEISNGRTSSYRRAVQFTKNMPLEHTIGFVLTYRNAVTGETEKIVAGATAQIQNYPASHYLPSPSEVLAKVNPTYRPGNTDYSKDEKTVFVNAKGYSSPTKYLLWISRSAQKVNVFEGSKGNWKLIHAFPCATGKSSSPTPVGVTYVTYKQTAWVTDSYTCRPIVRFYPGTGYAFHSRLYYPGTNRLKDASIGFPVSAGCVRMMDEGINWIYNNVPSKTTVVIY